MAMTDVLCHMKEKALREKNPRLFTWATLTGHVILAHGAAYSVSTYKHICTMYQSCVLSAAAEQE